MGIGKVNLEMIELKYRSRALQGFRSPAVDRGMRHDLVDPGRCLLGCAHGPCYISQHTMRGGRQ
jgi:hypothetical protein